MKIPVYTLYFPDKTVSHVLIVDENVTSGEFIGKLEKIKEKYPSLILLTSFNKEKCYGAEINYFIEIDW